MTAQAPIGIFDSGVGGLTVARRIFEILPGEDVVYFGDVGRYPYGGRSKEIITRFTIQDITFLMEHKVKFIICACNTASSVALDEVKKQFSVEMIGVIEPGAKAAVERTKSGRIGVIGTNATINSNAYARVIHDIDPQLKVFSLACPLFVPLAEEGYIDKEATILIARDYLKTMHDVEVDTLVLGCTHYPLLKHVIADVMGDGVTLIDSGAETAKVALERLSQTGLLHSSPSAPRLTVGSSNDQSIPQQAVGHPMDNGPGAPPFRVGIEHKFFVSDVPEKFSQVATRFLGRVIDRITRVDISGY
ncbi:MAG TPA: glutamate racemase [Candidatus Deferrimicrobium sp.]|nr:glutamate racemase [Candidatus Deferrimicrobium sp.]